MVDEKMEPLEYLRKLMSEGGDPTRELLKDVAEALMSAEATSTCGAAPPPPTSTCGAEYGARTAERQNRRNGYRERPWDTRAGTIALSIPKLRQGTYFPTWLLEPRRRAEKALTSVVVEAYVQGVSTRRVEDLVQSLGIEKLSKSQVSAMAKELDSSVKAFRERKLDGRFPYLWLDAIVFKSREGGRIANVAALVAVGVNEDGHREVLGIDVVTGEDGAGWLAFLRGLKARGLRGVELVISDAHAGLKDAIHSVLRGSVWQRCRTHFMRNLLTKVPKSTQPFVATLVRSIFAQPDADSVREQHKRVVEQLRPKMRDAANMLDECKEELLAFTSFPKEHWKQIWSNNPQERLNRELRRRTDVVGIFPNRDAIIRLVGAVLMEMNDDWAVVRRYMSFEATSAKEVEATEVKRITEPTRKSA
jgi:transposase-like protein